MKKLLLLLLLSLGFINSIYAEVEKTKPVFPIMIAPFMVEDGADNGAIIANIIRDNLNRSGQFNAISTPKLITNQIDFNYWKEQKKDAIVFGKVDKVSEKVFNVSVYLYDVYSQKQLYAKKIAIHNTGTRRIAHYLSDKIYYLLLGQKGAFDTRLSYVTVSESKEGNQTYRLQISDSDGYNPQTVVKSAHPILSPSWSPDQNKIAYVSFKNGQAEVFVQYLYIKLKALKLPKFDGLASAPAWHPSGESLALTLSKSGNQDIYLYHLKSEKLERLTTNVAIDTEANFSPDGNSIVFTSNRTGQVQIYIKNLETGETNLVPIKGKYNSNPVYSPNGKKLALIHQINGNNRLSLFDIENNQLTVLTKNSLDDSPAFSPNGEMIIFSTKRDNKSILSIISFNNNQFVELAQKDGELMEPSWSNYSQY